MKVESLTIENFKRFEKAFTIDFKNCATDDIANQFLILGDNGTGKTTILQAIGLSLSMVSRKINGIHELDWFGWLPARYWRWGAPRIKMTVTFEDDEIAATREAAGRWHAIKGHGGEVVLPTNTRRVDIGLEGERFWVGTNARRNEVLPEDVLFRGRGYAAAILEEDPTARDLFERLPGVFWFDQLRNLATGPASREFESDGQIREERVGSVPYAIGVSRLREHLNRWSLQQLQKAPRPGQVRFLQELENHYKKIFPGRSFSGPEPKYAGGVPSPFDFYFLLTDGDRTYDIEEMSAGEQAVFPILYEFVRQRIRNSVVLIDEIDLNLHPPLAQALLASLPHLGPHCQFIFTTHSRAISEFVSPHEVYRLKGGRPCL